MTFCTKPYRREREKKLGKGPGVFEKLSSETKLIFDRIQKGGPQTKNNLSRITGMKLTTLIRLMEPLEEAGLVEQCSIGESTGGRKPALYDIRAGEYYLAGVDISRTYTQVVITDLKLKPLFKQQFPMDEAAYPEKTAGRILEIIKEAFRYLKADMERLLGVGVGTVGPMDRLRGLILNPVNFEAPGWSNVPIKAMLESGLPCPVFVDNGANAAALAEMLYGKAKGIKSLVYINCGIGLRTGAISSGRIVRTMNDAEDAFGHMVIDVDGEPCSCGNFGCIECYSSIHAVTGKFEAQLKKGRISTVGKAPGGISYLDICRGAEKKDELAKEVLTDAAVILGTGLANFINLFNPDLVILSGPLIQHSNLFYRVCTEVAAKKSYMNKGGGLLFNKGGHFEENAIPVGSAAMVLENCLDSRIVL